MHQNITTICLFSVILLFTANSTFCQGEKAVYRFDFYGDSISIELEVPTKQVTKSADIGQLAMRYYDAINITSYQQLINRMLYYKELYKLDDWLYYQLIRKIVQQISAKSANYERYTVYKWFLLKKSGYNSTLKAGHGKLLLYVQTNEQVFNLPVYSRGDKQFVCLNYHDYRPIEFSNEAFSEIPLDAEITSKPFTYRITQLPGFSPGDYIQKEIRFNYYDQDYHFNIKLNTQVQTIFKNYPVVDYASYFNIPLSNETYQSLIPLLKKNTRGMKVRNGVDFLMRFTRYAFLFESDTKMYGEEKRLSPEQTLLQGQSDCDDRAALFFFLVKEIYNLPMIVLSFPEHVTIAVKFEKPFGKVIEYNGGRYSICEPTPQSQDLDIGKLSPALNKTPYEIVYAYEPTKVN